MIVTDLFFNDSHMYTFYKTAHLVMTFLVKYLEVPFTF